MKMETVKTFILIILIGTSFLLTFALWTYQPNERQLNNPELVHEVNVGGTEERRSTMIQPSTIIFHYYDQSFGFEDPRSQHALFGEMQTWEMDNFDVVEMESEREQADFEVELHFPEEIPMELVPLMFSTEENTEAMPSWSFDQIYVTFNEESLTLDVAFLSVDGRSQATAEITQTEYYNELWTEMTERENLTVYLLLEEGEAPVYFPEETGSLTRHSLSVTHIAPDQLVSALFSSPSVVNRSVSPNRNMGGSYFTDGIRELSIDQAGNAMEFFDPAPTDFPRMDITELMRMSISSINDHKGWTGEYNLLEINETLNKIRYQMYFDGYPVFHSYGMTDIVQEFRNQRLHRYERPLFRLNNSLGSESEEIISGTGLYNYLQASDDYNLDRISDIQIGYVLTYHDPDLNDYVSLEPAWFMEYNNNWQEIHFGTDDPPILEEGD